MQQARYILENSFKSLIRTKGLLGTSILILLLSVLTFLAADGAMFFSYWQRAADAEAAAEGAAGVQMMSFSRLMISVFGVMLKLLAFAFLLATTGYIRRVFQHFALSQQGDFLTMSYIGETTDIISLEFALQAFIMGFILLLAGDSAAFPIFRKMLADASSGDFADLIRSFRIPIFQHVLILLAAGGYPFLRTFFSVRRSLRLSFEENAEE